ncbi:Ig-like domain-containing protein [Noviherbaspirillum pedocola]|uniref:Ig-like domain-containing protein n=1 Tax=Noviherbaspirillum pedocola TaxID=2801341 RepID=A0A934SVI0_9BURK|nr:Ig-like domain-containing protein [Noviherbaspirillum pedocola]MBK4737581.1 Ig-like domain-containing protein [Noviherbaspirillum pedocola]
MPQLNGRLLACLLAFSAAPALALADGVSVRYDLSDPQASPFPSDRFTVTDFTQNTMRRVQLPLTDCAVRVSDCQDIRVLNTLDGFSTQPRITIPFDGAIDPATVNSDTVYLLNLGDTVSFQGIGEKVGINQAVWDKATNTLVFQPDKLLNEHTRYLVVVTDGVHDLRGKKIKPINLFDDVADFRRESAEYRGALRDALRARFPGSLNVAAASLFTTQSISSDLYRIMASIKKHPSSADFMIGKDANGNAVRAVFPVAGTNITIQRQTGSAPVSFTNSAALMAALQVSPGAVDKIAYGTFDSPNYLNASQFIPAVGTLHDTPKPQGMNKLVFQLFLPSGTKPAGGWPVIIFGHGFTDSMYGAPWTVASTFAKYGFATMSIQVVGHGGGELGKLQVTAPGGNVSLPAGGRGYDQDGNGKIDSTEGVNAAAPYTVLGNRDGLRQTVIDIMQLVQTVKTGVDVDGDGKVDLDASRIFYSGQSFGGIYGTMLLGVEPDIAAGVPNVAGGSITEVARLGVFRGLTYLSLAARQPSLINVKPGDPLLFNENIPLRNEPIRINTVPGAMAIQRVLDWNQWAQQSGNPVSYAPYLRKSPLQGNAKKDVIFQFARGDQTVPNPTITAILRAGELADRATQFRNDLALHDNPAYTVKNPHTFLTNIFGAGAPYAVQAQTQIATFFATRNTIDPDGALPYFEVPTSDLPETTNFIP